jgi:hypothetical protein
VQHTVQLDGIGFFAVQNAKSYASEFTGVCSTRNLDLVRSIGGTWSLIAQKKISPKELGERLNRYARMIL